MSEYELFRQKHRVIEWKDGAVYITHLITTDWFDMDEVDHPNTYETNILYRPPASAMVGNDPEKLRGIRKKKKDTK